MTKEVSHQDIIVGKMTKLFDFDGTDEIDIFSEKF